jgi:hypothetical protein
MTVPAMMLSGVSPLPEPEQDDSGKVVDTPGPASSVPIILTKILLFVFIVLTSFVKQFISQISRLAR